MNPKERVVIAQTTGIGKPRSNNIDANLTQGGESVSMGDMHRVVIVGALDETEGEVVFYAGEGSNVHPCDLTQLPLDEMKESYDHANEGSQTLSSARKNGASTRFIDTDAMVRANGGDPSYRIRKPSQGYLMKESSLSPKARERRKHRYLKNKK